ncbi:MAG: hypothetical protein AB4058_20315 [Microcystaceae cyanobacterium]
MIWSEFVECLAEWYSAPTGIILLLNKAIAFYPFPFHFILLIHNDIRAE